MQNYGEMRWPPTAQQNQLPSQRTYTHTHTLEMNVCVMMRRLLTTPTSEWKQTYDTTLPAASGKFVGPVQLPHAETSAPLESRLEKWARTVNMADRPSLEEEYMGLMLCSHPYGRSCSCQTHA